MEYYTYISSMEDRKNQIETELFLLKIELNSNYSVGQSEVNRCKKIFDRVEELRTELEELNK